MSFLFLVQDEEEPRYLLFSGNIRFDRGKQDAAICHARAVVEIEFEMSKLRSPIWNVKVLLWNGFEKQVLFIEMKERCGEKSQGLLLYE